MSAGKSGAKPRSKVSSRPPSKQVVIKECLRDASFSLNSPLPFLWEVKLAGRLRGALAPLSFSPPSPLKERGSRGVR